MDSSFYLKSGRMDYDEITYWNIQGINLEFINEPHINTGYYKKKQAHTVAIAKSGRESVDNLIQSVLTAITEFQKAETKEKIRVAFELVEKEVTDLHKRISQGIQTTKEKNQLLPPEERRLEGERAFSSEQKNQWK